ncbi:TlyA family RNA methyltransferase [Bdellovibrio sp. HCB337]|uniref:TlyA family RNA methyltransferase n=1 Tax=Bdellovibrio sp. HCB337 TaxID=3394358 RepID=UPI0039A40FDB
MRLDLYLVQKKLASSRTHAQELIHSGQVYLLKNNQKVFLKKPNHNVNEDEDRIHVEEGAANRFVSRGGLKLEGALQHCALSVKGLHVLDVGISTGGFSDCLLQSGAAQVLGVDVGHGQLHSSLVNHPQLKHIEGLNAREIDQDSQVKAAMPKQGFDLIVMDVSFISITLIIPQLLSLLKPQGHLLSLVKPQFEVGPEGLGKGGLVKDPGLYSIVEDKVRHLCENSGMSVKDYFNSPIEGKDGNKEFFIFAQKK